MNFKKHIFYFLLKKVLIISLKMWEEGWGSCNDHCMREYSDTKQVKNHSSMTLHTNSADRHSVRRLAQKFI